MADAVAVDTWEATGIRLGDAIEAVSALRDQSNTRASARTAVMTLVAVAPTDEQAYAATNVLRSLAGHHPARLVIVRPDPDQPAELKARATLYAMQVDDHRIYFEEVMLAVHGQAAFHLDSFVEAFTLSDLPVAVWYVNAIPDPSDPLLSVATAVLLDSRDAGDSKGLRSVLEVVSRGAVVDLSWIRLAPWRELLAGLFDPPERRPWLTEVEHAEVTGKTGPRRLLGGWLAGQLHLQPGQVTVTDGRHVEIRLACRLGGDSATFTVERGAPRVVSAQASLPTGQTPPHLAELVEDPLPTSLASGLTHLQSDPIWTKAVSSATSLAI